MLKEDSADLFKNLYVTLYFGTKVLVRDGFVGTTTVFRCILVIEVATAILKRSKLHGRIL
jgi:hypothetical protein